MMCQVCLHVAIASSAVVLSLQLRQVNERRAAMEIRGAKLAIALSIAGVLSLWAAVDVAAGEEMFNDYTADFGPCPWCVTQDKSTIV